MTDIAFIENPEIRTAIERLFALAYTDGIFDTSNPLDSGHLELSDDFAYWEKHVMAGAYMLQFRIYRNHLGEGFEVALFRGPRREIIRIIYEEPIGESQEGLLHWHFSYARTLPETVYFLTNHWLYRNELGLLRKDLSDGIPVEECRDPCSLYMIQHLRELFEFIAKKKKQER